MKILFLLFSVIGLSGNLANAAQYGTFGVEYQCELRVTEQSLTQPEKQIGILESRHGYRGYYEMQVRTNSVKYSSFLTSFCAEESCDLKKYFSDPSVEKNATEVFPVERSLQVHTRKFNSEIMTWALGTTINSSHSNFLEYQFQTKLNSEKLNAILNLLKIATPSLQSATPKFVRVDLGAENTGLLHAEGWPVGISDRYHLEYPKTMLNGLTYQVSRSCKIYER